MLPRSQSIFHLGEERGAPCHRRNLVGAPTMISGGTSRRLREGVIVGLQILVHHQHQHHGSSRGHQYHQQHGRHVPAPANIVLKQMVGPPPRAAAARHGAVSCSFLKACSLCRRELSPNKDVYMYRGDHGFCSEECRWRQILVDEARKRDAIGKERRGLAHHQHHHSPHRTPIHGWPRETLLAVVA